MAHSFFREITGIFLGLGLTRKRALVFIILPLVLLMVEIPVTVHAAGGSAVSTAINFLGCTENPITCALSLVGYSIFEFVGVFLAIVEWLFNKVVVNTIFGFATIFGNSTALLAGWGVLRDICNIALLFGFVFMGIATILNIHGYEVKKTLPRLIIFAVLLNFSLLAAEAIIDVSNIFSSVLYQQASICGAGGAGAATAAGCDTNVGIAGMIAGGSGSSGILHPGFDSTAGLTFYLGLSIVETVLMVVLLAAAILLIIRAVVLVFLMILSPIGFAGLAVPFLEKYAKKWWDTLLAQSFFAPALLLLLFIGLKVGEGFKATLGLDDNTKLSNLFTNMPKDPGTLNILFLYAIMIGFMIAALMVAKQMGAYGATMATSVASKTVAYPFAYIGRNTTGRLAAVGAKRFNARAGAIAKRYGALQPTSPLGKAAKWVGGAVGTEVAQGVHGTLKSVSGAKMGGFSSFDDVQKRNKEYAHDIETAAEGENLKNALTTAIKTGNKDLAESLAQKMSMHTLEETIKNASHEQVQKLAEVLSPERFEEVMKSKEVPDHIQQDMRQERFKSVLAGTKDAKLLSAEDLVQMSKLEAGKVFLRDRLITGSDAEGKSLLKEDQLEALGKSKGLSDELRQLARDNTAARRADILAQGTPATATTPAQPPNFDLLDHMTSKQKAQMRAETLVTKNAAGNPVVTEAVKKLSLNDVSAIIAEGKLSGANHKAVSDELWRLHEKDPDWQNSLQKNKTLAQQINWKTPDKELELLQKIVDKL